MKAKFLKTSLSSLLLLSAVFSTMPSFAQTDSSGVVGDTFGDTNELRQRLLIDPIIVPSEPPAAAPGSSAGTPTGYGASAGQGFVGGGLFIPLDGDNLDGSLSTGVGFGDPIKSVGVEVGVNITSIGGQDFDFGDSGTVGVKVHKYLKDGTAVAVAWSNPIKWGDAEDAEETFYGVATRSFDLKPNDSKNKLPLTVSLGIGTGSFRSKGAIQDNENSLNIFGSAGLRVSPEASVVTSWTGNALNLGGSFAPFKKSPVVINAVLTDVTDNLDNGVGLSISGGYSFKF